MSKFIFIEVNFKIDISELLIIFPRLFLKSFQKYTLVECQSLLNRISYRYRMIDNSFNNNCVVFLKLIDYFYEIFMNLTELFENIKILRKFLSHSFSDFGKLLIDNLVHNHLYSFKLFSRIFQHLLLIFWLT